MYSLNPLALSFIINLPALFVALVVHEYAHGFVAHKLGDNTAKFMGRLTFNPLAHIDPFGTIILPLMLLLTRSPVVFGYAKPIPVNFHNLANPRKDMIWVGLAGPLANFIVAALTFLILLSGFIGHSGISGFLATVMFINLVLGTFNLIPIPPLDGSRILLGLLPGKLAVLYARITPMHGMIILIILLSMLRRVF
ncbi:MAG: site-2 protease family protein [Candidatus Omnitrophica bacterium]|nr:site-2 protease family protein [Candidatus Omnitrophota bacterium]